MAHSGPIISHWHQLIDDFDTSSLDFYAAVEEAVKEREVPDATFSRVEFSEGGVASAKREYLRIRRRKISFDLCAAPYGRGFFFSSWLVKPGPKHPWIWLAGVIFLVMIWLSIMLGLVGSSFQNALTGRGGGTGCLLFLGLFALPGILWGFCWAIRENHLAIDEDDVLMIPFLGFIYRLFFNPLTYFELDSALMFQESVSRAVGEAINSVLSEQGLRVLSPEELKPTIRDVVR